MNNKKHVPQITRLIYRQILLLGIIFFSAFPCGSTVYAGDILVVQSYKIRPYDEALRSFKNVCNGKISNLVFHELDNSADIARVVRKTHPELILAIGMEALAKVKSIKNIPVVYLMVLQPHSIVQGEKNITGVSMNIPPEKHLATLHKLLPSIKRIGLLYDPRRNGSYAKKAYSSAKAYGFELVAREVYSSRDVPGLLENMKERIDLLWVLPDITVVTPETTGFLLLFSVQNNIPVHIFSSKYLDMGAFTSLDTDPIELGKQAGEIAARILAGADVSEIAGADASNPVLSINLKVAKKLGITIPPDVLHKARVIR